MALAGKTGQLSMTADGLIGTITILNDCSFRVSAYTVEPGGPAFYWWGSTATDLAGVQKGSKGGGKRIVDQQISQKGFSKIQQDYVVGAALSSLNYLYVWCEEFNALIGIVDLRLLTTSTIGSNQTPSFENCLTLSPGSFNLYWTLSADKFNVEFGIEYSSVTAGTWAGFGLSDPSKPTASMDKANPTIVGIHPSSKEELNAFAMDYFISSRNQCSASGDGVCPRISPDSGLKLAGASMLGLNHYLIRFSRSLKGSVDYSFDAVSAQAVPAVWAMGPHSEDITRPVILYHGQNHSTSDFKILLSTKSTCSAQVTSKVSGITASTSDRHVRGTTDLQITLGPNPNYPNPPGWGTSFYVNGIESPVIHVVRGVSYTFSVHSTTHPLYLTSSVLGGKGRLEGVSNETVFGGEGGIVVAGDGSSSVATLVWTPTSNTPDILYYQCYTHQKLGWKVLKEVPNDVVVDVTQVEGFDDTLDYTENEEKRVRLLVDTHLMPFVLLSMLVLHLDRTNLSSAISGHLPETLGFTTTVINNAGSIYALVFSVSAVFGAILAKRFSPHRFIPILVIAWGLVTLAHAFVQNANGFYILRFLLALTEGGVIPATLVYLGSFYKKNELATRLSWFWGVQALAGAISGLMASGLLQLEGVNGLQGWRWLFLVDGIITIFSGILFIFGLPRSPYHTKGCLFRGGWLNERQGAIAVTRVVRDDLFKLNYNIKVKWSDVSSTLTDYRVWGHLAITAVGLTHVVPFGTYLPSIINGFGFNVYISNALTAPNYALGFISMAVMTAHSDKVGERGYHGALSNALHLVGFLVLQFLPDNAPIYVTTLFISLAPFTHPLNIAWLTENTSPIGKRTVASGLVIAVSNLAGIWGSQIFQPWDAPRYHTANYILVGLFGLTILLWINQKFMYIRLNKQQVEVWEAMPEAEREDYRATTTHEGSQRLDFVFKN
ncbi:UNVERIFIED_CONTAM: hypothetical protein HDU68_006918 [Siphonaria sp. JEL0065]|nr:hypothetical protein HDU68_006918 [Siphonaria sp. JEL0065]